MKNYLILMIVSMVLVSCNSTVPPKVQSTVKPAVSATQQSTLTPTFALRATGTSTPTATFQPTEVSNKLISTPSKKDSDKITLDLLRSNKGCNLPCFWGMVPNQTQWHDAESFLKPFSHISLSTSPKWAVYFVRSPIALEFSELEEIQITIATQSSIIKEIEIEAFDEVSYHMPSFLEKYGIPGNIFISTYSSDYGLPPNKVPLSIALYYPDKGIMATYGTYADVQGENIIGCLEKSPILFLWSPAEHNRSMDYILGWDKKQIPYMSSEQAMGLDVNAFYEKYSNSLNAPCFRTAKNLWPDQ